MLLGVKPPRTVTRHAIQLLAVVFLLFLLVIFLSDIYWLRRSTLSVVENAYAPAAFLNTLVVTVREIDPHTGMATFDMQLAVSDIQKTKFECMVESGGVILFSDRTTSSEFLSEWHRTQFILDAPVIVDKTNVKRAIFRKEHVSLRIESLRPGYYFPFDSYLVRLNFTLSDEHAMLLDTVVHVELTDPHFLHSHPRANLTHGRDTRQVANSVAIALVRPMSQRVVISLSMLATFVVIGWSLVRLTGKPVNATTSFEMLGLNFAILLGIPDLRGMLVPSNLQVAPFFDFSVAVIWLLSLFTVTLYLYQEARSRT